MRLFLILLAFCLAAPASAQTPEERARLDWALQRGRLLFEIDRAAWVTTDDLQERVRDLANQGVRGWTVERDGNGYGVTYYAGEGDARVAVYRGRVENRRVVSREIFPPGSRPLLTPVQRRLADARGAIGRMGRRPCTAAPFNSAVIPPDTPDGPIDVYALTAQTEARMFPFGGHFRATLSPAGEILAQRDFTRACINMPTDSGRGGRTAGLMITHLLDKVPTEIHVFMAIWTGLPIYVGTADPQRVWEVTGTSVRLVDPPPAPRA